MKFKFLKSVLVGILLSVSSFANAGLINLIELDVFGDNTNKGYTLDIDGYGLEWLDFDEVDGYSYNQVKEGLPQFSGWRIARKDEVFSLFETIFSDYTLLYQTTDTAETISFTETVDSRLGQTHSSYISIFDVIGGRLKNYDYGWLTKDRFSVFFDSGFEGELGYFQLVGTNTCDGVCSESGFGVHIIKDESLTVRMHERQAEHDSVMLVRDIYVQQVSEPSTLAIFALGMIGLASRRFKKQ